MYFNFIGMEYISLQNHQKNVLLSYNTKSKFGQQIILINQTNSNMKQVPTQKTLICIFVLSKWVGKY